jgi:hypothetical protein
MGDWIFVIVVGDGKPIYQSLVKETFQTIVGGEPNVAVEV